MTARHWLASYGSIPAEIDADAHASVVALTDDAMIRFAGKTAFVCAGQQFSYAEIDALSGNFCAYLQSVGVKKGDRVAVMLPNIAAFPIALLGIIRAGAVQVNVNPLYTPRELEHQLRDSGSEQIVIYGDALPTLAAIIANTPVRQVLVAGRPSVGDALGDEMSVDGFDNAVTLRTALARGSTLQREPVAVSGGDLLFLQYTGGTTGLSKGAALSHRNLVANTEQFKAFMSDAMRPGEEVIVTAIPLYHIFALMVNFITYFSVGAENWLVANPRDAADFMANLKAARPSIFLGVNTLYASLIQHPQLAEVDWSRLRLSGGGGAAIVRTVSERWKAITGSFIREGYGLSETSPVLSFNPSFIDEFNGTTGLPLPSTDIRLLDDKDQEVAAGEAGEICVKGPQVMRGYWEQPEANASAFTADGYFRTGDIGMFDAKGFLKIVDRKKDMIIVSGFNVYPNEVEAVATACTGVTECACVGVPDEKTGEAVELFVVKAPQSALTEQDVIAHCRAGMVAYKVPKIVRIVEALPKSAVGKILRRELRQPDRPLTNNHHE
ncbi:long-chain fatty acid--CoA ligase [Caballeronia arationis]|jgi:long-chain acyl-CoA synthetase|uniref:Long-chain-fatty-acid--CoA ligase n=1 Tax=Caballeronia arationis TaxID=1777142 RepID=A0A7Z7I1W7_9BURK|nr:AMP-binding protein [Caballeronia arationis]SAL06615.1 long-chain fatty acid--CoA ligase [Caballeronia arationis]SOE53819.1 long-chain acyl-CoA synthetase [Caballeronia arationis]